MLTAIDLWNNSDFGNHNPILWIISMAWVLLAFDNTCTESGKIWNKAYYNHVLCV